MPGEFREWRSRPRCLDSADNAYASFTPWREAIPCGFQLPTPRKAEHVSLRETDPRHATLQRVLRDYGAKLRALIETHGLARYGIDPDDIEQEVRIRLWKALERDQNSVFHALYIQRTVASTVIDALRRLQARPVEAMPEDEESLALQDTSARPDDMAGGAQYMTVIASCLAELPGQRGQVVALHLQGFRAEEISGLVNVSVDAVRKLLSRGLEQLKLRLTELGCGDFDE